MCFDTALSDISNGAAMSVTRVGPRVKRSMIARLVGSASAIHTASVVACITFNLRVEYWHHASHCQAEAARPGVKPDARDPLDRSPLVRIVSERSRAIDAPDGVRPARPGVD